MKADRLWISDLGDGRYQNPVLLADYSDPDAIWVGDTCYLTASSFNYTPGLPILTSKDLVNWTLVNYALKVIPEERYDAPQHAQGVWAPAIRFHSGRFYIFYGMPDEGIFMVSAQDPLGQWDEPVCVLAGKGLIDPCPFWDEDGKAYVVHAYAKSRIGFKSFLGIFPLSPDGRAAIGEDHLLYDGQATQPTIEGPKVYKRNGLYYIFAPAGGVEPGWQTVLRSSSLYGPFEERVVLRQGTSPINGPHQGAWVETPSGEDWFLHFQSRGCYGRVMHLQPMVWGSDNWPVIGVDSGDPQWGMPCLTYQKPAGLCQETLASLQASDDFAAPEPALQWQFMGNRKPDFYELSGDGLKLFAKSVPKGLSPILWHCPQALTQKLLCPCFTAEVTLQLSGLKAGEQAGLAIMGGQYAYLAVRKEAGSCQLVAVASRDEGNDKQEDVQEALPLSADKVQLMMTVTPDEAGSSASITFACSTDGQSRRTMGQPFTASRHTWVGSKLTLFSMALEAAHENAGYALFQQFRVAAK